MERSAGWPGARLLSVLVPLVAAFVMWRSLVDNYFFADDFLHLFDLVTLPLPRFLTQIWPRRGAPRTTLSPGAATFLTRRACARSCRRAAC